MRIAEPAECQEAKYDASLLPPGVRQLTGIPPDLPLRSLPPRRRIRYTPSSPIVLAYRPSYEAFAKRLDERLTDPCLVAIGYRQYVVRQQAIGLVVDRLKLIDQIDVRPLVARDDKLLVVLYAMW